MTDTVVYNEYSWVDQRRILLGELDNINSWLAKIIISICMGWGELRKTLGEKDNLFLCSKSV